MRDTLEVAHLEWDLDEGTVHDPESGRRMALIGPFSMDSVLHDLEAELGPSIPEVVVEAQRKYVKSRIEGGYWRHGGTTFNRLAAIRGVGNITRFEADENEVEREHRELLHALAGAGHGPGHLRDRPGRGKLHL